MLKIKKKITVIFFLNIWLVLLLSFYFSNLFKKYMDKIYGCHKIIPLIEVLGSKHNILNI